MAGDPGSEPRRLEHRRSELVRLHEKALERVALFPNAVNRRQVAQLASDIEALDARLRAG
jgi:hypothetical protein